MDFFGGVMRQLLTITRYLVKFLHSKRTLICDSNSSANTISLLLQHKHNWTEWKPDLKK
uniref:Uncharacterized protein n=1 Tax=Arundo donax TaxID=35708 RepID=A0A0A9ATJ4_ARUDO